MISRVPLLAALLGFAMLWPHVAVGQTAPVAADPCAPPKVRHDERPDAGGSATVVSVGVFMADLTEINDVKQTLTGDFLIHLMWTDPRLAHLERCSVSLDAIWSPKIVVVNSGRLFSSRPREVSIGPNGHVTYVQRYFGTMASYHHLREFPFDRQEFQVSLVPIDLHEDKLQLQVADEFTGRRALLNISDWTIESVGAVTDRRRSELTGEYASRLHFQIRAHRLTGYYIWKIFLPLTLIVIMSWCVFWINPAQYGPQIGLSATSMLTLIAFIFATTNMVPVLGYFTVLDKFIVGSTILVFLALLQSLTTSYLAAHDRTKLGMRIDIISRFGFPLAFLVFAYFALR